MKIELNLTEAQFNQLQAYVRWAKESGTFYGKSEAFNKRHLAIKEALGMTITKEEAEAILRNGAVGRGRSLMCKEYGEDDDWCEVTPDDLDEDGRLDDEYQTFQIWS